MVKPPITLSVHYSSADFVNHALNWPTQGLIVVCGFFWLLWY